MSLSDIVRAPTVRPVLVGFMDFKDDPAYGWTGNGVLAMSGSGVADLDGNLFAPLEGATDASDFVEDMANGSGVTLTFAAPDNDADIVKQIVRDRRQWLLRKMKIFIFFQLDDETDLHPFFRQLFSGVMVNASMSRKPGEPGLMMVDGDTDYALAAGAPARVLDHGRFYSDAFTSWMLDLFNGGIASVGSAAGVSYVGGGRDRGSGGSQNPKYSYER